ncbi:hypothetical protein EVAR_11227_1 [Eumeta japonica]|uniref:Reverse transcriptase domain-containing protein n=1 Tax=Eumeta variegata TaxID=151549 RepID=A0A4C1ZZP9_EUMVA|nr:hypothetical protein EVAR_11227_1 [Eumeta japonica]
MGRPRTAEDTFKLPEYYKDHLLEWRREDLTRNNGKNFEIKTGVRQGDFLSPKSFAALESIFYKLDWKENTLNMQDVKLNDLSFTDNSVIFEENPMHLKKMIESLNDRNMKVGLCLNKDKTKVLTNSEPVTIKIDNHLLEYVQDYIYQGQIMFYKDQTKNGIEQRIRNGWKKYCSLEEVMKSKELSLQTKRKVFTTCILPLITYVCKTWALIKRRRPKMYVWTLLEKGST